MRRRGVFGFAREIPFLAGKAIRRKPNAAAGAKARDV
jgi:hypothetical protein